MRETLRRIGVYLLLVAMLLTGSVTTAAASFSDVSNPEVSRAAEMLGEVGVVKGFGDGTFRPYEAISRAQAAAFAVRILGLEEMAGLFNNWQSFSDCPGGEWYSGYTTIAANKGILKGYPDGTFHPNESVSYAQMLAIVVRALGYEQEAQDAGGWPIGYLQVAFEQKLTQQLGSFNPNNPAIRGDVALILKATAFDAKTSDGKTLAYAVLGAAPSISDIEITASSDTLKRGEKAYFSAKVYSEEGALLPDAEVEWAATDGLISATGVFYATDSGQVTVSASFGGKTSTYEIGIVGIPAILEADGPSEIVANGVSEYTLRVKAADENGIFTPDFEGSVQLSYAPGGDNGATTLLSPSAVQAEDGVAEFIFVANPGNFETDKMIASASGLVDVTYEVTAVEQQAAGIKVVSDAEQLAVNEANQTTVRAYVVDQSGAELTHGIIPITFKVSGHGELVTNQDGEWVSYYMGNSMDPEATAVVTSLKGMYGFMTITATAEGLPPGTATVKAVVAGSPARLKVSANKTTAEAGDVPVAGYDDTFSVTVAVVDKQGTPVEAENDIWLVLDYPDDLKDRIQTMPDSDMLYISRGQTSTTFDVAIERAGTWLLSLSDESGTFASTTIGLQVKAGPAAQLTVLPSDVNNDGLADHNDYILLAGSPVYVKAAVTDAFGNSVAGSGGRVEFRAIKESGQGKAYLDGSTSERVKYLSSSGEATVTFTATLYDGDRYHVEAAYDADGDGFFDDGYATSADFEVTDSLPTNAVMTFKDISWRQVSAVTVGDYLWVEVKVVDANGIAVPYIPVYFETSDENASVSQAVTATVGYGVATVQFLPGKAGMTHITAKVINLNTPIVKTQGVRVYAGMASQVTLFNPNNETKAITYDSSGVYGAYYIRVTDSGGNVTSSPKEFTLTGTDLDNLFGGNFDYRLQASGLKVSQIVVPLGSSGVSVWVEMSAPGTVTPSSISIP